MHGCPPQREHTPDDSMHAWSFIYDPSQPPRSAFSLLSSTLDVDYASAANKHSLLLPNWIGCLHSFVVILRCLTLFLLLRLSIYTTFIVIFGRNVLLLHSTTSPGRHFHKHFDSTSLAGLSSTFTLYQFIFTKFDSITTVMSMQTHMNTSAHVAPSNYSPVDAINRHDYGVQKNRKQASTGGGRAWSEDEVWLHVLCDGRQCTDKAS